MLHSLHLLIDLLFRAGTKQAEIPLDRPFHPQHHTGYMQTRHPASANPLLLGQQRSLAVRIVDILPSEARHFLGLGMLSGLDRRQPERDVRSQTEPPLRPDLSWTCFNLGGLMTAHGVSHQKATGYSNIYEHSKSRQISRGKRMIEGPRGIMKGLSR